MQRRLGLLIAYELVLTSHTHTTKNYDELGDKKKKTQIKMRG